MMVRKRRRTRWLFSIHSSYKAIVMTTCHVLPRRTLLREINRHLSWLIWHLILTSSQSMLVQILAGNPFTTMIDPMAVAMKSPGLREAIATWTGLAAKDPFPPRNHTDHKSRKDRTWQGIPCSTRTVLCIMLQGSMMRSLNSTATSTRMVEIRMHSNKEPR